MHYYYVFCVTFCGLKSQSHSDDSHVHATAPCFVSVFAQAPQYSSKCHLYAELVAFDIRLMWKWLHMNTA